MIVVIMFLVLGFAGLFKCFIVGDNGFIVEDNEERKKLFVVSILSILGGICWGNL